MLDVLVHVYIMHTFTLCAYRTYADYVYARAHASLNLNTHAQIGSVGARSDLQIRIEKRPFLGGWFCTKAVVISIRATDFVPCREVVLFSEGPLWEVRLYILLLHFTLFHVHVCECVCNINAMYQCQAQAPTDSGIRVYANACHIW